MARASSLQQPQPRLRMEAGSRRFAVSAGMKGMQCVRALAFAAMRVWVAVEVGRLVVGLNSCLRLCPGGRNVAGVR